MQDEMTASEIMSLWPDVVALRPRKVVFTGGEPLLLKDNIFRLLSGLREVDVEHDILRCLNTNGSLVTETLAKRLVGLADEVRISVDAMKVRHDSMRGKGSFCAAISALEKLYAVGFEPIVLVTVTEHSLPDLEELICFLIKKNIKRIHLNEFHAIGRGKDHNTCGVEQVKVRSSMLQAWNRNFPDHPPPPAPDEPSETSNCGAGSFINIMPNGDVYPCHVLMSSQFLCGNIRDHSLLEICNRKGILDQLSVSNIKCPL